MKDLILQQTSNRGPGSITFSLNKSGGLVFQFSDDVVKSSGSYILEFRAASGFEDDPNTYQLGESLLVEKGKDNESARSSKSLNVDQKIEACFGLEILRSENFGDIAIKSENKQGEIQETLNPNLYKKLLDILSN